MAEQEPPKERDPTLTLPAVKKQRQGLVTAVIAVFFVVGFLILVMQDDKPTQLLWVQPTGVAPTVGPLDPLTLTLSPAPSAGLAIESYAVGPVGRTSWRPQAAGGDNGLTLSTIIRRDVGLPEVPLLPGPWKLVVRLVAEGPAAPPPMELSVELTVTGTLGAKRIIQ